MIARHTDRSDLTQVVDNPGRSAEFNYQLVGREQVRRRHSRETQKWQQRI
jgi:hypothetical protein